MGSEKLIYLSAIQSSASHNNIQLLLHFPHPSFISLLEIGKRPKPVHRRLLSSACTFIPLYSENSGSEPPRAAETGEPYAGFDRLCTHKDKLPGTLK